MILKIKGTKLPAIMVALVSLGGCATSWHNPNFRDVDAEKKQFAIDDAYCRSVAYGAVPMPNIRIYNPQQNSYQINATANTYNYATSQFSTSNVMGTIRPVPANDFYSGLAHGFSNGIAIGTALKAKEDRDAVQYGCMLRLGWVEGERKVSLSAQSEQEHLKQCVDSTIKTDVAILRVPRLAHAYINDHVTFRAIAKIDTALMNQSVWAEQPLTERFDAALRAYETIHGQLPHAEPIELTDEVLGMIARDAYDRCTKN